MQAAGVCARSSLSLAAPMLDTTGTSPHLLSSSPGLPQVKNT